MIGGSVTSGATRFTSTALAEVESNFVPSHMWVRNLVPFGVKMEAGPTYAEVIQWITPIHTALQAETRQILSLSPGSILCEHTRNYGFKWFFASEVDGAVSVRTTRAALADLKVQIDATPYTPATGPSPAVPVYTSLQESPAKSASRQDLGVVRRFIEHMLKEKGFTEVQCKAANNRIEIMSATKGIVKLKQTAAGISKEGIAFLYPTFAQKLGVELNEMDQELRCLLR